MSGPGAVGGPRSAGEIRLEPHAGQQAFLDAKHLKTSRGAHAYDVMALFAGRRGGKTKIGGVAAGESATQSDSLGWCCAPSYPELLDYVIPATFDAIRPEWVPKGGWSASRFTLSLTNRAQIGFRSLDDPERGRGPGLNWLWMDESRKIAERAWDTILPALMDKAGQAWLTTSPNGFDWNYRRFWLPAMAGEPGFWAIKYRSIDNPAMARQAHLIERARRQLDPLFFKQEFEAEFVSFTGSVYGDLLETQILDNPEQIRKVLPEYPAIDPSRACIVGLDPGADHPFAGVLLVSTEAGLVVCGEHLKREAATEIHVQALRQMVRGLTPETWAIDRSQKQTAIELAQFNLFVRAAENEVVGGIRRVQSWLKARQLWFIQPWVPKTVNQLRSYRWAENTSPLGEARREAVQKVDDDLPDALRYALMTWPALPGRVIVVPDGRDWTNVDDAVRWQLERLARTERDDPDNPFETHSLEDELVPIEVDGESGMGWGDFYGN